MKPWKLKLINQIETYEDGNLLVLHMINGEILSCEIRNISIDKTSNMIIIRKKLSKLYVLFDNVQFWEIVTARTLGVYDLL